MTSATLVASAGRASNHPPSPPRAFSDEEVRVGFRTIGVPILGADGSARFAPGLRGTTELMTPDHVPGLAELARHTADDIRQVLCVS